MVFSLKEVVFREFELLEHRLIYAGLQFVLGVADHSSQIRIMVRTLFFQPSARRVIASSPMVFEQGREIRAPVDVDWRRHRNHEHIAVASGSEWAHRNVPRMKRSRRTAYGIFAAMLLALCPIFAVAQNGTEPMAVLDLQFDQKKIVDIARFRQQIAELSRAEAAQVRAKKRDRAALAELRRKLEDARNGLADLAVDYVAQLEMAEALVRLNYGQTLVDRFRKDFSNMRWRLEQRANAGDARASATLGCLYRLGIVAERSEAKSCDYYQRAAQTGHVASMFHASACGDPKSAVASRMSDLAAVGGHPVAQEMKGRECLREKADAACALAWLGRAAAQGRASAQSLLGWMYSTGELVPPDDQRAFAYLMDAAKLGDVAAENNVGQMYETGRGTPANDGEAFTWYKRAAEAGLGSAQVNLARSYIEGRGTAPDRAAAKVWLEQAQKQSVAEAGKLLEWLATH
jgi:TPR repeat protein